MKEGVIKINLRVEGRIYPLEVPPNREASLRYAEKEIKETIEHYRKMTPEKDLIDWLFYTSLHFCTACSIIEDKCSISEIITELDILENKLTEQLNSEI